MMALYRAKWPLGTESRLMFDILHDTFLRLVMRTGLVPLTCVQIERKTAVQIATEKSRGDTTVTVPVHPEFAESLRAARRGRHHRRRGLHRQAIEGPCSADEQESMAMKFKKYAVLAGVNEPRKSCHGVREARADFAAYADCTESQMMAMFGRTDPKMPAHYIARASREKLGISGMGKIVAFDQSQSLGDFISAPGANSTGTSDANKVVTLRSNFGKIPSKISCLRVGVARSEGAGICCDIRRLQGSVKT